MLALALALAPGVAIALYIYLKDKHEREPISLLLISFFYGALSVLLTLIISMPLEIIMINKQSAAELFADAFFKVALVEEFSKFVFIRFILFRNKNFNEPFDGIVYAAMVGMGFATLENILYVYQFGIPTGIMRMFTAVPAHACFAILMGYYLGRAKFIHNKKLYYSLLALISATVFHGLYDYFLFITFVPGIWIGAVVSLIVGIILSRKAIKVHQAASPFINPPPDRPDLTKQ
ncbi:MAG TPA: PrsW family glutamic-type intramembrane protease [Cyclobacteriaceae bacterium]|nr:PrsW family intramembrane metalloprotease [Cyclobacteriaceae bacterium]HMV07724.1 PrsW family glutamic-type intramembrane protease [Cyclobacteriaceae bacterium]HMW98859.1 PrsW family glutamic-type intramembrane protease [Cyclobacteriaceae bacterium]HMX48508.1 PrsW family glutamic-type intramembrane protease [Cyclobacteriaceae bacterium]HMY95313.1 PrsW family glutamic-type intramembrane protease [Cyclobacteriaceae bacterium]